MSFNCVNNYIPEYVPKDLPWYERDGLMSYINQAKCEDFLTDSDNHFITARIFYFDTIRRKAGREKVLQELLKHYQTMQNERVKKCPPKNQKSRSTRVHFALKDMIFFTKKT